MGSEDIDAFLNTPDENNDEGNLDEIPSTIIDDVGNEFVGIRMIAGISSSDENFLEKLRGFGFSGVPKFNDKYAHLKGKVPEGFIEAYDAIAASINDRFEKGTLAIADMQKFEDDFAKVRVSFKAE